MPFQNPFPTADNIIEICPGIVLIGRANPIFGWAIGSGFVEYGESLENAVCHEALEETGLKLELLHQFHAYSDPSRDSRQHNILAVFIAKAIGTPKAGSGAKQAQFFTNLPKPLAFDHAKIMEDYYQWLEKGTTDTIKIKPKSYKIL